MPQSLSWTTIHTVFSTKNRVKIIDENIEKDLFGMIGNECNKLNCKTIIVGGYLDHIHILCQLHRTISQSDFIKTIKSNSSIWMKQQGQKYSRFYWQDGYAIFSVGLNDLQRLWFYIKNQRDHHRMKTYKEEYMAILEEHKLDYNEDYLWD